VPNACDWDDVRTAGLKTRALENLVGVAMANYPTPVNNGESQANQMLIAKANEQQQILLASFWCGYKRGGFRLARCKPVTAPFEQGPPNFPHTDFSSRQTPAFCWVFRRCTPVS